MPKNYISEEAHDAVVLATERLLAWQNWGVDNVLTIQIAHEAAREGLNHLQMTERLCGNVRAAISSARLEGAGARARASAAEAIAALDEPEWWSSFRYGEVVEIRGHRLQVHRMTREEPPGVGNWCGEWLILWYLSSPVREPSPVIHVGEIVPLKGHTFVVDKVYDQGIYLRPSEVCAPRDGVSGEPMGVA
jgi:hypothetical protein